MPAKSKVQRKFMGIALAMKKGKLKKSYSPEANKAAKSMSKKALRHFAKTKEKGLPERRKNLKILGGEGTRYPMLTKEPDKKTKYHIKQISPGKQLDRALWPKAKKFNRLKRI